MPATAKAKAQKVAKVKYNAEAYNSALASGDYLTALGMLESVKKPNVAQELDKGMLRHYIGDYELAAEILEKASAKIGDYFASLLKDDGSKKAGGGSIASETATPYNGNIYEYLLIDSFNALNYYKSGNIEDAYSRVVRVSDKQQEYGGKFGYLAQDDEAANEQSLKKGLEALEKVNIKIKNPTTILPAKPTQQDIYRTSAFANYLQVVLAAQNGSEVDEYIVKELNTLAPNVDTKSANLPASQGRIEVLAFTGSISQREENVDTSISFPTGTEIGEVGFKYVWPVYKGNANKAIPTVTKITLNDGTQKNAVLLEDFDKAVEKDVKLNARKAAWRSIIRSTTTKAAVVGGAIATIKSGNDIAKKIAMASASPTALAALDLKEVADLRQSMALPSKAYCAGFDVAPGTYTVTVTYSNGKSETIEDVIVKAGKPVLVESICK